MSSAALVRASAPVERPNVVIILADDLGYGDPGCYRPPWSPASRSITPNIDRMAAEGVRFTKFKSAGVVCTPARVGLLTGRYALRTGVVELTEALLPVHSNSGLPAGTVTLAHCLQYAGYETACIGKWHLGCTEQFSPTMRGGFNQAFWTPFAQDVTPIRIFRGTGEIAEVSNSPDRLVALWTAEAVRFINKSKDSPFFLYLSLNAPHFPYMPSGESIGKSGFSRYGDCVLDVDRCVGRVLEALNRNGVGEQTLVIFMSDNGPAYLGSTGGLRGRKRSTYEGGCRVPCVARWPNGIKAGLVYSGLASALDVMPTITGLCGAPRPSDEMLDGADIQSVFWGATEEVARKKILLHFSTTYPECCEMPDFKLRRWLDGYQLDPPFLYDMKPSLPPEDYDVSEEQPAVVADMLDRMNSLLTGFPQDLLAL
jgi:arylsulfatase A